MVGQNHSREYVLKRLDLLGFALLSIAGLVANVSIKERVDLARNQALLLMLLGITGSLLCAVDFYIRDIEFLFRSGLAMIVTSFVTSFEMIAKKRGRGTGKTW